MSNDIGKAIELIDGTSSKKSYIVVQEKEAATLAIKPELHYGGSSLELLLRIRAIADRGSIHGILNHVEYLESTYSKLPFTKLDEIRGSYYVTAKMPIKHLAGFFNAESGEFLLRRLIYKVILALASDVQAKSGCVFFNMHTAVDFLTDRIMFYVGDYGDFNSNVKHQLPLMDNVTELFQLPDLTGG